MGRVHRAARVLLLVCGFGLAVPGLIVSGLGLLSSLPYLLGQSCSMGAMGLLALPYSVPVLVLGSVLLWVAWRS